MSVFDFEIVTDCQDKAILDRIIERLTYITEYQFYYSEDTKAIRLFEVPWYGMPTDMKLLSSEFKDVFFVVYGSDDKDIFMFYFKDGNATDIMRSTDIFLDKDAK